MAVIAAGEGSDKKNNEGDRDKSLKGFASSRFWKDLVPNEDIVDEPLNPSFSKA